MEKEPFVKELEKELELIQRKPVPVYRLKLDLEEEREED